MEVSRSGFAELRLLAHKQVRTETAKRIAENPLPTPEELRIGCFREMLEPQVRTAVLHMNRIGYFTIMSGFWGGGDYGLQHIDGQFRINATDRERLSWLGVHVYIHRLKSLVPGKKGLRSTCLEFIATIPNLEAIRKRWDEVATALTVRDRPARRDKSFSAHMFRYQFGGEAFNVVALEKLIMELEGYGNCGENMGRFYRLRDAVYRGERNLVQLGFF